MDSLATFDLVYNHEYFESLSIDSPQENFRGLKKTWLSKTDELLNCFSLLGFDTVLDNNVFVMYACDKRQSVEGCRFGKRH